MSGVRGLTKIGILGVVCLFLGCPPPDDPERVKETLSGQFDALDGDEDGGLTFAEASAGAASLSEATFSGLDLDGDGLLNRSELRAGCAYALNPLSAEFGAGGGDGAVQVAASAVCGWEAQSSVPWITVLEAEPGTGRVIYRVQPNSGPERSAQVSIGPEAHAVTQADGCTYSVAPASAGFTADGGAGTFSIEAGDGCPWTVSVDAAWVSLVSPASGTGDATIAYQVQANTGAARVAHISAAGETHTVNQADGCGLVLSPLSNHFAPPGGTGTAYVGAGATCSWTAQSDVPWVSITSNAAGTGTGEIHYAVAINEGPARSGRLIVASQEHAIHQEDGCVTTFSPHSADFSTVGGSGIIEIETNAECSWFVRAEGAWINFDSMTSGKGPATVSYTVAPSPVASRTGTIYVDEEPLAITQRRGQLVVSTLADTADGDTSSITALDAAPGADGAVSLREAIVAANNTAGADEIGFSVLGEIRPSGELPVIGDLTGGTHILGPDGGKSGAAPSITVRGRELQIASAGNLIRRIAVLYSKDIGIRISGADAIGNRVEGCAIHGCSWGVLIDSASGNIIGGAEDGQGNTISGFTMFGVVIQASDGEIADGNAVRGNRIEGNTASPDIGDNFGTGISISECGGNYIGGRGPNQGNVLCGLIAGIGIAGSNAVGNFVEGNAIGTAPASNPGRPNQIGVHLGYGASENFIGGATPSARNDIVSTDQGILLTEPGTMDNAIQGNYIRGTGTPVGPAQTGILVRYSVQHNVIGGAGAGAGNSITQIQGHGVHVEYNGGPSAGIEIRGNSIHDNAGDGIHIDEGCNGGIAPPVLSRSYPVKGSAPPNATVEIFVDTEDQGAKFVGSAVASANGGLLSDIYIAADNINVTATATDAAGNTSAFSEPIPSTPTIEICPLPQDFSIWVAQLWRVADIDEDGGITKEEVLSLYPNDDIKYILDYWFLSCDGDSDGYFRREEGPCLNTFASIVRSELDPSGDGIISWFEARGYMSTEVFDAFDVDHDLDIDCHDIL